MVRHPLVQDVIRAYNHLDRGRKKNNNNYLHDTRISQAIRYCASHQEASYTRKLIPDFVKKIAFQRWASVILLSAILSLLLTPQLRFSYPEYKAGSIALRDVRADRRFSR